MIDLVYTNGDSWTYGSELEDRTHAWPWLVSNKLGYELFNASVPGSTNDKILRTTVEDCLRLQKMRQRPLVLIAWTQLHRFELPIASSNGDNYFNFVNPNDTDTPAVGLEIWKLWSTNRTDVGRWAQQQLLLGTFLKTLGIPYQFFITFNNIRLLHNQWPAPTDQYHTQAFNTLVEHLPKAIHHHPLEQGHCEIAEYVLAKIEEADTP